MNTLNKQAKRVSFALAVVGAFATIGAGSAQAAASFASANISIEPRGETAGGLTCTWRETGLAPSSTVYYDCKAGAVGALKACTYKNRVIYNSPTRLDVFKNVQSGEHGSAEPFLSQKNGQISASMTTAIPEIEVPEGQELCTAPSEETVIAVRWCNASLTDVTNNITGATVGELFQEFYSGVGTVPSCANLLAP